MSDVLGHDGSKPSLIFHNKTARQCGFPTTFGSPGSVDPMDHSEQATDLSLGIFTRSQPRFLLCFLLVPQLKLHLGGFNTKQPDEQLPLKCGHLSFCWSDKTFFTVIGTYHFEQNTLPLRFSCLICKMMMTHYK